MTASRQTTAQLAARAWTLMFDYLMASSPARARALERRGLTPNDARGLWSLDVTAGRPIGSLAADWACDPANATFIIGRLEAAGLVRRQPSASDRRIKLVTLTTQGAATKRALLRTYRTPPHELRALSRAELAQLVALFTRLAAARR